ncbi:MAG: SPFH domain-containing protein [Candidatus Latescibacter sp.]|nr:SPFH domain-containing protein [Candidatus Latescibacter sp.]
MKRIIGCFVMFLVIIVITSGCGCARIDTGEIGLRKEFTGTIQPQNLNVGLHQTVIGDVIVFASKEILLTEEGITPASKDKSTLKDFDINFTYIVQESAMFDLYTKYSATAHMHEKGSKETFLMANFVRAIVRASAYSAVAEYNALEVNNNRKAIEDRIKVLANEKLVSEKLGGKVAVNLVNIKNIQLADEIVASANMVSNVQNQLTAKKTEVEIANQEALRIKALSAQSGSQYTNLLTAQATLKTAEALYEAAKNGSAIWVVPQNFTALGGIGNLTAKKQ